MDSNTKLKSFSIFLIAIAFTIITIVIISGRSNQVSNVENNRGDNIEVIQESIDINENDSEGNNISEGWEIVTQQDKPLTIYRFIGEFYQNITYKNYEAAYAVAPLGRSFEQFISTYEGVETIREMYSLNYNGLEQLRVEITNTLGDKSYYDVLMDIQRKDDNSLYIAKAESRQLENLYYLDNTSFPDRIGIKQAGINQTTQTNTYLNENPSRTTIIPGKIVDNSQYLITFGGAGAVSYYGVYLYHNSTNTIEEVKVFEVWPIGNETDENGNLKAVVCNDYDVLSGTDPDLTPCMLQYKDTDWYKNNLEAKNELPKYIFNDL